jgi:protein-disulfide isomerase
MSTVEDCGTRRKADAALAGPARNGRRTSIGYTRNCRPSPGPSFPGLHAMKTLRRVVSAAAALTVFAAAPLAQTPQTAAPAQAPMTQQQINEEMLKELRQIRQLLERLTQPQQQAPPPPARGTVTNLKGYALGKPDAPLTMVEFTDLQCPFCRQYVTTTFDQIKKEWIDTGRLRYISRDFPIEMLHPQARTAARAARCAGEQGKFWEMRLTLMRNANLLTPEYITRTAADLKLDPKPFAECTASTRYDAEIAAEQDEGTKLGVGGTPTFVIGRTTPTRVEGPMIVGAMPYSVFDAKLKEVLASK